MVARRRDNANRPQLQDATSFDISPPINRPPSRFSTHQDRVPEPTTLSPPACATAAAAPSDASALDKSPCPCCIGSPASAYVQNSSATAESSTAKLCGIPRARVDSTFSLRGRQRGGGCIWVCALVCAWVWVWTVGGGAEAEARAETWVGAGALLLCGRAEDEEDLLVPLSSRAREAGSALRADAAAARPFFAAARFCTPVDEVLTSSLW